MSALEHQFRNLPVFWKHETFFNRKSPELKKSIRNWYPAWAALLAGIAGSAEPEGFI